MAYYLYTLTAYNNSQVGQSLSSNGRTAVVEHNFTSTQCANTTQLNINAASSPHDGQPAGYLASTSIISSPNNPFNRVNSNTTKNFSEQYFGLVLIDAETLTVGDVAGTIGAAGEVDWAGSVKSLTWHTPSLAPGDFYTLIVPTDRGVYQTLDPRTGNVLVWHIPTSELGVYGQNANLPTNGAPVLASDSDEQAGGKIWAMGFGLINQQGNALPYVNVL